MNEMYVASQPFWGLPNRSPLNICEFPGGGGGGLLGSIFAGYVPLASQISYSIIVFLWPIIDPILVTFEEM